MGSPPLILVVEDNQLNLDLIGAVLRHHGFEVEVAGDADECYARLSDRRPDLVLMDVQLPGEDGLEITRKLRADPATHDLLIVAVTAYAMAGDAQRVMDAGCDGYVTKPIDTRTLAAKVNAYLSGPRNGSAAFDELHPGGVA
jgi:CheY-like chemotaxis protein